MKRAFLAWTLLLCTATAWAGDLTLGYTKPATKCMNEALPIGNGRIGGMIHGDPAKELIVLNEDSLWTGGENPTGDYGKMGAYQKLGSLQIELPGHRDAADYRRELNIGEAVARTRYKVGGVTYTREYFCSHPAGVLVVRLTADKPAAYTGAIVLDDAHKAATEAKDNTLEAAGQLNNGMKYLTRVVAKNDGGSLTANSGKLDMQGCNGVTIYLAAGTNYAMDCNRKWRGEDPAGRVAALLTAAADVPYEELKKAHVADFQSLFNRVSLDLGKTPADRLARPIDERKVAHAAQGGDPELEALMFQYGRYLLISCSRPGGLPANLQGLWNDSNNPPWHSDYHTNINVQMNYWPAEPANLAECHEPLFDLILSQLSCWRKETQAAKEFKTAKPQGWTVRTSHGIHGDMGWKWDNTSNAWYGQHFWLHYAFGGDKKFLRETAYPVLKEVTEFWAVRLKPLPDGRLVIPNGWSPEHGPTEDGVSYSQQIVYDLFTNYVAASQALGVDADYRATIAALRDKLVGPKVGSWGQLQEWMTDRDDPKDHHRHTSHLFAVYPGCQIGVARTPEFAAAAHKSLAARGETGDVREWSFAWRTALMARLHDGEGAHRMFQQLLANRNTCLNLFGLHPPMQMDGNFGSTAGVCEMLVQSQDGAIDLLPAMPKVWSAGSFEGLRALGGFEVSAAWKDGKLASATVVSKLGGPCRLRYGKTEATLDTTSGGRYVLDGGLNKSGN